LGGARGGDAMDQRPRDLRACRVRRVSLRSLARNSLRGHVQIRPRGVWDPVRGVRSDGVGETIRSMVAREPRAMKDARGPGPLDSRGPDRFRRWVLASSVSGRRRFFYWLALRRRSLRSSGAPRRQPLVPERARGDAGDPYQQRPGKEQHDDARGERDRSRIPQRRMQQAHGRSHREHVRRDERRGGERQQVDDIPPRSVRERGGGRAHRPKTPSARSGVPAADSTPSQAGTCRRRPSAQTRRLIPAVYAFTGANDSTKPATPTTSAAAGPKVPAAIGTSGVSDPRARPYARVPMVAMASET